MEETHKVAAKIKQTTDIMTSKINEQGAILDDIEGHVIETKKNTENANKEIVKANDLS